MPRARSGTSSRDRTGSREAGKLAVGVNFGDHLRVEAGQRCPASCFAAARRRSCQEQAKSPARLWVSERLGVVGGSRQTERMPTQPPDSSADPLAAFSLPTRAWFRGAFEEPTAAQAGAWAAISRGESALVVAPTGSGKTLAAFLWSIDRLAEAPAPDAAHRCRVLYVSPLKALAVDVERNLRTPLTGIRQAATRLHFPPPELTVGIRTGDTPADQRRRLATKPPDILITTPESLFLMLTSQARESLRGVETVIVDEVHAVAATKRGAHLALSLERLDTLLSNPAQRIGLSATVRPVDEVATFLGGMRPVTVIAPPSPKVVDLEVVVPVED